MPNQHEYNIFHSSFIDGSPSGKPATTSSTGKWKKQMVLGWHRGILLSKEKQSLRICVPKWETHTNVEREESQSNVTESRTNTSLTAQTSDVADKRLMHSDGGCTAWRLDRMRWGHAGYSQLKMLSQEMLGWYFGFRVILGDTAGYQGDRAKFLIITTAEHTQALYLTIVTSLRNSWHPNNSQL